MGADGQSAGIGVRLVSCAWIVCPVASPLAFKKRRRLPSTIHTTSQPAVTMPRNVGHALAKSPVTITRNTQARIDRPGGRQESLSSVVRVRLVDRNRPGRQSGDWAVPPIPSMSYRLRRWQHERARLPRHPENKKSGKNAYRRNCTNCTKYFTQADSSLRNQVLGLRIVGAMPGFFSGNCLAKSALAERRFCNWRP